MIIFRCNISKSIGSGHLFRCLELYKSIDFDKKYLLIKSDSIIENYRNLLSNVEHKIISLEANEFEYLNQFYKSANHIETHQDSIILDLKDTTAEYIIKLKNLNFKIIDFDDLGEGRNYVDALIDANIHNPPEKENHFFGPDYIFLPQIFSQYNIKKKYINNEIISISMFFGGADPENISGFIFENINKFNFRNKHIRLLTFDKKNSVENNFIEIIEPKLSVEKVAEIYFSSDLLIIAGGLTLYEAMCIGVPGIVINQNEEQFRNASFYNENIINAGIFNRNDAVKKINQCYENILDFDIRSSLSAKSKKQLTEKDICV